MEPYYYCYIADKEGKTVLQLPVTPTDLPVRKLSSDSEDFLTVGKGYRTIIGDRLPWETEPEFMLPDTGKKLSFQMSNVKGRKLKNLVVGAMNDKKPLRFMIVDKNGWYYINNLAQATSVEYYIDKKRDWHFSLSFKEWNKY